ncbi:MAG: HIT family protein [Solirubrobacteraceae bacterium]|jgi:histidine triad (HIT) family protein
MAGCIFCAIVAGEAPATIVDEDGATVSFMDINPLQPGHALVVPRRHCANVVEIDPSDLAGVFVAARRLAARMKGRLDADGVLLLNSCGAAAGQVVMHFHLHVIPVKGEPPPFPRSLQWAGEAELAAAASALRRAPGDDPHLRKRSPIRSARASGARSATPSQCSRSRNVESER